MTTDNLGEVLGEGVAEQWRKAGGVSSDVVVIEPDIYHEFNDHRLLAWYEDALVELEGKKITASRLEQEIFRRIQERGGTTLPVADENGELIWDCEQVDSYSYDHSQFTPLLEKFNATELKQCWEPERIVIEEVTYPAKWLTQQLKAIAKKHGDGAPELVERARVPTGRKLKFERAKKKEQHDVS